jgi:glyoxylase-like metal-dependent hydrolase (beta-lactamase superfamily II)
MEQIEEILPGIYRIPVPLKGNPLKELNSYFIRGRKNLLIDTGFRAEDCKKALYDGLSLLGARIEDTDILLTHLHSDHSGNAPDIVTEGNRVYMGRIDRTYTIGILEDEKSGMALLHHSRAKRLLRNGISRELLQEMYRCTPSRTMAPDLEFTDYIPLDEGDEIEVGDYTLRAIHTPGHTPGQMCFEILQTGAMILGDHVLFDITPNITDWRGIEDSLGDYLASLDKIDQYDVTIPLPGHRKPGNFHERIAELKSHHAMRLSECERVIGSLKKAQLYDIAGNMTWKIRAAGWDDFPPAQRWFALGECLSHIDHLKKTGRITEHDDGEFLWYEAIG